MSIEKNLSIELLKFIAVLLILNSHMDVLYGNFSFIGTGGSFGDAIFFFVSGFTIFIGRIDRFDNWYKRRIKRIYPSIIVWTLVLSLAGISQICLKDLLLGGGYWFIKCIMLYYVALYLVRKFAEFKPIVPFVVCIVLSFIWFILEGRFLPNLYGPNYIKWMFFFLFMLAGAYVGNGTIKLTPKPIRDFAALLFFIAVFYCFMILADNNPVLRQIQIITLVPLMGVVLSTYSLCCTDTMVRFMHSKVGGVVKFIAGLCLEAYIVQVAIIPIISKKLSGLFPLNILITVILVMILSYIVRCLSRLFCQIFDKEPFDWKAIL